MKRFLSRYWLPVVLGLLSAGVGPASAGSCGPGGCSAGEGGGFSDYWYEDTGFNRAWVYPRGGYTLYPGQAGSCVESHSDYSRINWVVPPTANAQAVLDKLRELDVPLVPPDTIYLGKNPRLSEDAKLPIPKGWTPKEVEPKEAEKPKDKNPEKPKDKPNPKYPDDDDL